MQKKRGDVGQHLLDESTVGTARRDSKGGDRKASRVDTMNKKQGHPGPLVGPMALHSPQWFVASATVPEVYNDELKCPRK